MAIALIMLLNNQNVVAMIDTRSLKWWRPKAVLED